MNDLITVYSGLSLEDFLSEGVIDNGIVYNLKSNSKRRGDNPFFFNDSFNQAAVFARINPTAKKTEYLVMEGEKMLLGKGEQSPKIKFPISYIWVPVDYDLISKLEGHDTSIDGRIYFKQIRMTPEKYNYLKQSTLGIACLPD